MWLKQNERKGMCHEMKLGRVLRGFKQECEVRCVLLKVTGEQGKDWKLGSKYVAVVRTLGLVVLVEGSGWFKELVRR